MADFLHAPPHTSANLTTMGNVLSETPFVSQLESLIGPSNRAYLYRQGTDQRYDLATVLQNHEGRAEILGVFLEGLFAQTENAFIFQLFRLQRFGDQNWETYSYSFESGLAEERPSQSGPPTAGWKQSVRRGQLKRYTFGVKALIDSLKDPKGQMIWYAQSVQCAQAFVRTLESLALTELVNSRAFYLQYWAEAADFTVSVASRATTECATFDIMHRYENACGVLKDLVENSFAQSQRGKVTAVIFPQGMRSRIAFDPTKTEFYRRGPGSEQFADLGGDAPSLQGTLLNSDVKVFVASPINASAQQVYHDPMKRTLEFGSWTAVGLYGSDKMLPSEYRTSYTSPSLFHFHDNNFRTFTAEEAIRSCCRWDAAGNLSPAHARLAKDAVTVATNNGLSIANNRIDMMIYERDSESSTEPPVAKLWGHVAPWALVPDAIYWHAETMKRHLLSKLDAAAYAAFMAGDAMKKKLYSQKITQDDYLWMASMQTPPQSGFISRGHYAGGPLLNDIVSEPKSIVDRKAEYLPRGFGSSPGMITLALEERSKFPYIDPKVFEAAEGYTKGVEAMFEAFVGIYGEDHALLNPAYVPIAFMPDGDNDWARKYKALITFAYNVLDGVPPVLQLQKPAIGQNAAVGYASKNLTGAYAAYEGLRGDASPLVRQTFVDDDKVKALATKFNSGPMAAAYRAFVAEQSRNTQSPIVPVTPINNPFESFMKNEVDTRIEPKAGVEASVEAIFKSWAFSRLLEHIITATNLEQPYTFQKERLDALVSLQLFNAYLATNKSTAQTFGDFYNTRLVADPARVYEFATSNAAANAKIRIASPTNQTASIKDIGQHNSQLAKQQQLTSTNLADSVISTQARPGAASSQARVPFQISTSSGLFTPLSDVGVDVVVNQYKQATTKTNANLMARIQAAMKQTDVFLRVSALMFIMSRIQEQSLINMCQNNVYYCADFLLVRPRRTYVTVCAIWLAIEKEVGVAAYSLADVRRGIDPIRKLMFDNWSMYLAVIVTDATRVIVTPDIAIIDYKRGETTDVVYPASMDRAPSTDKDPSMYVIMMPAMSCVGPKKTIPKVFDIRGRFPNQILTYKGDGNKTFQHEDTAHYSSALYTAMLYGWDKTITHVMGHVGMLNNKERKNTIVGEELVKIQTPLGELQTMPSDLMGTHVYPGVASERISGKPPQVINNLPNVGKTRFITN